MIGSLLKRTLCLMYIALSVYSLVRRRDRTDDWRVVIPFQSGQVTRGTCQGIGVCEVVELWDRKGSSSCNILHHRTISEDLQVVLVLFFQA